MRILILILFPTILIGQAFRFEKDSTTYVAMPEEMAAKIEYLSRLGHETKGVTDALYSTVLEYQSRAASDKETLNELYKVNEERNKELSLIHSKYAEIFTQRNELLTINSKLNEDLGKAKMYRNILIGTTGGLVLTTLILILK